MLVAIGRLRLKPGTNRFRILWHGFFAYIQAKHADGVVHSSVRREGSHTLWSLSVWTSNEAMLAYRNSGSHLRVMEISKALDAEVDFTHWKSDTIPTFDEAKSRLQSTYPSTAQKQTNYET